MTPVVNGLRQKYGAEVDFFVYEAVDLDRRAGVFASEHRVTAVPTMMIVDRSGSEVRRFVGAQDEALLGASLDEAIRAGSTTP